MVIPVATHHCGLLLYWTGCLWMYAMLHAVDFFFFVVFSLCLKPLLSQPQLLLLLWLLCAPVCHPPLNHCHCPLLNGVSSNIRSAQCGSATTADTKELLDVLLALPLCHSNNLSLRWLLWLMPVMPWVPPGRFLFQSWASHFFVFHKFDIFNGVCFLLSGAPLQLFGAYTWHTHVQLGNGHWPMPGMHWVAPPSTALSNWALFTTQSAVSSHSNYMVGYTALGAWQGVTQFLHLSCMVGRGLLFQVWFHPKTQSNLNLQWALNLVIQGMVIGYQVDEFTHAWSEEQLIAHSHIYPGLMGKVSSLTHFTLGPGCEDYSFLDQAVADFEQGLDSIFTDSIKPSQLDMSLDELDAITSSVSSGFLCSVLFLILLNCSLLLASGLINYGARLGPFLYLCLWLPTCQHLNWFAASGHPAAFGFWFSTSPDIITLAPANRKTDQNISEFQTGIDATAHATLNMEHFISHLKVAIVDTISSLDRFWGRSYSCVTSV